MEKKNFFPEPDIKLLSPHSLQNEYDHDHFRELSTSGLKLNLGLEEDKVK